MKKLDQMPEPRKRKPLYRRAEEVRAAEGEKSPDPTASTPAAPQPSTDASVHSGTPTSIKPTVPTTSPTKPGGFSAHLAKVQSSRPKDEAPHLIVKALAGTGKTTTLIEGLNELFGMKSKLTPSPQQEVVWDALKLSPPPRSSCFAAFNVTIAQELARRIPQGRGCAAKTLHGLGNYALTRSFKLRDPDEHRVDEIIGEITGKDVRQYRKEKPTTLNAVKELVGLCKVNLSGTEVAELQGLVSHYDIDLPSSPQEVYDLVPQVLDRCKDVARDGYVDFDDMIWLPLVLDLPIFRNNLMLVDEAQDLNRAQQEFAKRAGERLVLCGDPNQAIYGFAGADSDSMLRMTLELSEKGVHASRGCQLLPLTVTRRCGKAIVEEAKQIVPEFEAHESNPDGKIIEADYPIQKRSSEDGGRLESYELPYEKTYLPLVKDGDMILCRANAPLLNQCFRFLKRGQKAFVQGRKIGDSLIALLEKLNPSTVNELVFKLIDWQFAEVNKEMAQRNPSQNKIAGVTDRGDCLMAFANEASTVSDVRSKIDKVFTDNDKSPGINLSSIHRAKGLESKRVFYLVGFGRPMDRIKNERERQQEDNLRYVAITRAIEELTYVYS